MSDLAPDVRARLESSWKSVSDDAGTVPHQSGGVVLRVGLVEAGHLHPDGVLHLSFPRPERDRLVNEGAVQPHPDMPDSTWVSFIVRDASDLPHALDLLKLARDARARGGHVPEPETPTPSAGGAPVSEQQIDEASAESFPASDPPSVSHET